MTMPSTDEKRSRNGVNMNAGQLRTMMETIRSEREKHIESIRRFGLKDLKEMVGCFTKT